MSNIVDTLFGPLGKEYCIWFYFLSIFSFVALLLAIVPALFYGIMKKKDFGYFFSVILGSLNLFIAYFVNRLLHSMCMGTMA